MQVREENIRHVWYFWPRKADSSPCAVNLWFGPINQLANEIGLLAHVISKLKMAETTLLSEIMLEKTYLFPVWLWRGKPMGNHVKRLSISNGWNCLNASGSSAFNSRKRFGYAPCCWLLKIHSLAHVFLRLDLLRLILRTTIKVLLVPSCRFAYLRPLSWTEVRNFIISAIFKFEITCARHPISLANWLIRLSPIHTFTAHGEESAFRGQKYQTWQIFSSRPYVAKFSGKLRRTREEIAEQTALPGHLLSCFLSCAAGFSRELYHCW